MGKYKSDPKKIPPADRGQTNSGATEFLSKACMIYLGMIALGLFVMRYGHRNLAQVLPWPSVSSFLENTGADGTQDTRTATALSGALSQPHSWAHHVSQSPIVQGTIESLTSFYPSLAPYASPILGGLLGLTCALLSGVVLIGLAFLTKDIAGGSLAELFRDNHNDNNGSETQKSEPRTSSHEPKALASRRADLNTLENQGDSDYPLALIVEKLSHTQLVLLAFLTACGEEILFRGALQPYCGLLVGSILYGIVHLGAGGLTNPLNILGFLRGLFLGWIFLATQNLWICIGAEFVFNLYALFDSQKQVNSEKSLSLAKQT
jgi:hypothetical protein